MTNAEEILDSRYKFTESERQQILDWIAEGKKSPEIIELAKKAKFGAEVKPDNIWYYKRTRQEEITRIIFERDAVVTKAELAIRSVRLERLFKLAYKLEAELYTQGKLWLERFKGVNGQVLTEKMYNSPLVNDLRGVYDDIAKEVGGRVLRADVTSDEKPLKAYVGVTPDDWDETKQKPASPETSSNSVGEVDAP